MVQGWSKLDQNLVQRWSGFGLEMSSAASAASGPSRTTRSPVVCPGFMPIRGWSGSGPAPSDRAPSRPHPSLRLPPPPLAPARRPQFFRQEDSTLQDALSLALLLAALYAAFRAYSLLLGP
jgi:hypothetical protein